MRRGTTHSSDHLAVAAIAFTASADVRANAAAIAGGVSRAATAGAQLVVTPECALTGFPGHDREDLETIDWQAVAGLEDELSEQALERGIALVLGTASRCGSGVSDDALVCGAVDTEQRYRCQRLTVTESGIFVPGEECVVFTCAGWHVGIAIAYELRFPHLWQALAERDVDVVVVPAHLAGSQEAEARSRVLPALCMARAAEWVTPLVLCNCADDDRWLDSTIWDARGLPLADRGSGVVVAELSPRELLPAFYRDLHAQTRRGARV